MIVKIQEWNKIGILSWDNDKIWKKKITPPPNALIDFKTPLVSLQNFDTLFKKYLQPYVLGTEIWIEWQFSPPSHSKKQQPRWIALCASSLECPVLKAAAV